MTPAEDRAARGASMMDRRVPGWATQIDLERLHMQDSRVCVMGQIFGEYDSLAVNELFRGEQEHPDYYDDGTLRRELGFAMCSWDTTDENEVFRYYAALTVAWRAEVEKRIGGAT